MENNKKPQFNIDMVLVDLPKIHKNLYITYKDLTGYYINDFELDLDVYLPTYGKNLQREHCWTIDQKRSLIMTMIKRGAILPVCIMHWRRRENSKIIEEQYRVVDGKQRITAFLEFVEGKFGVIINGFEYKFDELDNDSKYHIKEGLPAHIMYEYASTPHADDVYKEWYRLSNFTGTPQQEGYLDSFIKLPNLTNTK